MLIWFPLPSGHKISQPKNRLKRTAITYKDFSDPKWFTAHNLVSEILRHQIPYEVSICQYGLGSNDWKKE